MLCPHLGEPMVIMGVPVPKRFFFEKRLERSKDRFGTGSAKYKKPQLNLPMVAIHVGTSGADSQSVQYVPLDIWTSCKASTHCKNKDHSWKPDHKLEQNAAETKFALFLISIYYYV